MQLIAIRRSDLFYGTGESYLFTFYPEFQVIFTSQSWFSYIYARYRRLFATHLCASVPTVLTFFT